jgi:hypothetical protein
MGGGALYAHLDLDGQVLLGTPEEWRCQRADDWQVDTPRVNAALGFVEVRDARREPRDWQDPGFDDTLWTAPEPCVPPLPTYFGSTFFPVLRPRALPRMHEAPLAPGSWTVAEVEQDPRADPAQILERVRAEQPVAVGTCHVEGSLERGLVVRTAPGRAVRLTLDFLHVIAGRPRIEIDGSAGACLDVVAAEHVDADGQPVVDVFGSRMGHRFVLRDGPQTLEAWDWIGFRYLLLTVREASAGVTVRQAGALSFDSPAPRRGAFECSDTVLTSIWEAGARTVALGIKDVYATDVAREQRQWLGDVQAALGPLLSTVGDVPLIRQALLQAAEAEPFGQFLPMFAPGDYRGLSTTIPDFTLRWLLAVDEFFAWTADAALIADLYPVVLRSIAAFEPYVDASGLLSAVPHWHFIDWAAVGRTGEAGPLNGLYLLALRAAARLALAVGHRRQALVLRRNAERVQAGLIERLWSAKRGLVRDGPDAGPFSQHANALALLGGVVPAGARAGVATALASNDVRVTAEGRIVPPADAAPHFDPAQHLVACQPGFMGFVLRALETWPERSIEVIRARWSAMASSGTVWETWSGRHSRCHPWAAAPTAALPRLVLGVRPRGTGGRHVAVRPAFVGDWARGRVPLACGDLAVAWQREGTRIELQVTVPPGVEAVLASGEELTPGEYQRTLGPPPRLASRARA